MIVMEYEGLAYSSMIRKDVDIDKLIQQARNSDNEENGTVDITVMPLGTEMVLEGEEDINDIAHLTGRVQEHFLDILDQGHFAYNLTIGDRKFQIEVTEVIRLAYGGAE